MVQPVAADADSLLGDPSLASVQAVFWRAIVQSAVSAPSLYNSQPWLFSAGSRGVTVLLDRSRVPAVADPRGRQSLLSCGAAVFNLRVALLSTGRRVAVTAPDLPGRQHPGIPVATVRVVGRACPTADTGRLFAAIDHRRTWVGPYRRDAVADTVRHALVRAASAEGARLHLVGDPRQQARTEELLTQAHRAQASRCQWREEYTAFTGNDPVLDTEPAQTRGGAVLAVLTAADGDTLAAGSALERVLLTAASYGLASTIHSQIIESVPHRDQLRQVLGTTAPLQAVLHLGYAPYGPVMPRRDVADFMV